MKKFLLVLFIGMVLAIDIYGVVTEAVAKMEKVEQESEVATVVYVE